MTVAVLGVGLFCTYAAIRPLIGGVDNWRLWCLAPAAQLGVVALRRAAGVKPHICAKHGRSRSWSPPAGSVVRTPGGKRWSAAHILTAS
jgi:hypothetical protein